VPKTIRENSGFFTVALATACIVGLLICGSVYGYLWSEGVLEGEQEQIQKLTAAIIPDNSTVLDHTGTKIGEYFSYYHIQIPYEQIPKPMINALLAVEDRKFFEHEGVNWTSIARAVVSVATSGHLKQGGSTLTMQLVKNYLLTREKKISRKLREMILAYYVEKNLSKERILELYLNTMYMGHGAYGVGAASMVYFGKPLSELSLAEMSLLAGLFQAPSAYDPHKNPAAAIKRQQVVLNSMVAANFATKSEIAAARRVPLQFKPWTPVNETVAPYFIAWIRSEVERLLNQDEMVLNDRGYKISTTLDRKFQEIANKAIADNTGPLESIQNRINSHHKRNQPERIESALLATDAHTGAILSMVGGRNFHDSQFNRTISSRRSPGSSFKPVLYSLALESGMTWSDLVYVSPIDVGGFHPKNHAGDDMTEVTLIKALAKSMNTPVVSLAQKFGIKNVIARAEMMGVKSPMKQETGVAIGGFSASMMDVDSIYRTIANDGAQSNSFAITKIEDRDGKVLYQFDPASLPPVRVFSPDIATLLRSGLQAVLTNGTGGAISHMAAYAVGKTGTSDDSRDNWFAGYTKNMVITTWVGGDANSSLGDGASGAALALPIWSQFLSGTIAAGSPSEPWSTPESMVSVTIDPDYGGPADVGIPALFFKDKVPKKSQATDDMKTIKQGSGSYRELKLGE
jgi:penicillin-binding protein 1A